MANILVVAAHADDEALGCGATMARHAAAGDKIRAIFMTDGEGSRGQRTDAITVRLEACRAACEVLGAPNPVCFDFPDNAMDTASLLTIAQSLSSEIAEFSPDIVYTHHAHDLNIDHRLTHEAVMTVFRPQPGTVRPTILAFEVPSSTEWRSPSPSHAFVPNWFEDVSGTLFRKMEALKIYEMEMRPWPHARSLQAVEHLARWRGACVGVEAAEAFELIRRVD